jgi:hypothetical protein
MTFNENNTSPLLLKIFIIFFAYGVYPGEGEGSWNWERGNWVGGGGCRGFESWTYTVNTNGGGGPWVGLPSKFLSEKNPRNRLGTVFIIPRNKVLILCDSIQ